MRSLRLCIEDGGFGRHVAIDNTELFRVGGPCDVVDRPFFVCKKCQYLILTVKVTTVLT